MKAIEGYEGYYSVTEDGRIYSHRANRYLDCKALYPYPSFRPCIDGVNYKTMTVHSAVAHAYLGPRPEGMQINHIDGNKSNNRVSNLEYVTPKQNTQHAFRTGLVKRINRGEIHNWAKLSAEEVKCLVADAADLGIQELADKYGLKYSGVYKILSGTVWHSVIDGDIKCTFKRNRRYDKDVLLQQLKSGMSLAAIADANNVSQSLVRKVRDATN